ncbi:MAG: BNR repeat-containing protein [Marinilabilia sp.]
MGFVFSVSAQPLELNPNVVEISGGWSRTSVNATVFRKNSVVSYKDHQYAAWYDSTGHVVVAKRALDSEKWTSQRTGMEGNVSDAHNIISIMVDGDGYLHMAWDHHDGPLNYCRSKQPGSLEFTERLPMTGALEDRGVTYPEFYKLPDGDLLFAYRYGASGEGNLVLNRYDTDAGEWHRLHDNLIDGEGERNAYWQMGVDQEGTIHLSWVWRETWDVATNHDLCYARSEDGGQTWQSSGGEQFQMPVTARNAEYALKIPQGSDLINQTSITADHRGRPYIASYWRPEGEEVPQFFVVYFRQGQWQVSQVTNRETPFSLSGGGSRRIPVSRPQVLFSEETHSLNVIFRDREQNNRICVASSDVDNMDWSLYTVPGIRVGQWEPSYDTELWREQERLHLYVQRVGQGEGNETPEDIDPGMVKILEFDEILID